MDSELPLSDDYRHIEDHLGPQRRLTAWERVLYYHLLRRTRLEGRDQLLFALLPLARATGMSDTTVREALRSLHNKGCVVIEDRSRKGHLIRVVLPREIPGVVPASPAAISAVDLEALDFFNDPALFEPLLARQDHRCFYCLRLVTRDNGARDHLVPAAIVRDNSYRNIVIACHECNSLKQEDPADDFVRFLYRKGVLSQPELVDRLEAIDSVKAGHLPPTVTRGVG